MGPGKTFNLFVIILLGLSAVCYGADQWCGCGFDEICPNSVPPCYKVVFTGVKQCVDDTPIDNNNPYRLKYVVDANKDYCVWRYPETMEDCGAELRVLYPNFNGIYVDDWDAEGFRYSLYEEGSFPSGTGDNDLTLDDCRDRGGGGYDGWVAYEPVWDCSWCGNCDDLLIDVYQNPNRDTFYYSNLACCPADPCGESCVVAMTAKDPEDHNNLADFVVPSWKIEIPNLHKKDPNDPNWVEVPSSSIVDVRSYPNACAPGHAVAFWIETKSGKPPAKARVTVTGAFYEITYPPPKKASASEVIYVEAGCTPCCSCAPGDAACAIVASKCPAGVSIPP